MSADSKLMEMLCGYAAAHQHPFNVAVHLIGIPTIMLGVFIPMTWLSADLPGVSINLAHLTVLGLFIFYLTLDWVFALAFLVIGLLVAQLAATIGALSLTLAWTASAAAFFGGYALQFVGHAVERSAPVILKHPIQANLAAPFFTIVEVFHLLGVRNTLFTEVKSQLAHPGGAAPGRTSASR